MIILATLKHGKIEKHYKIRGGQKQFSRIGLVVFPFRLFSLTIKKHGNG